MARRFTLLDGPYYDAMVRVAETLDREELPCCLVGGGASQAWIASLRTGGGARRLSDEPVLAKMLRRTRDLDFSSVAEPARMLSVLNELAAAAGRGAHVIGPRAIRFGAVSVAFTIAPEDLSGMGELYDRFLRSRELLGLRRGAAVDEVPVIGLPELLVTKLTRRGDKAKDILDVSQLLSAVRDAEASLDLREVRALLEGRGEAVTLLDEIERAMEEG